jgi:RNA polymerase sigma factor (sigma-70 family)
VSDEPGDREQSEQPSDGEALFLLRLASIERAIAFACHRASLRGADAEDFGSFVKLKLIESSYAVLHKFEGRCNFASYISIVVQRLLLDYRIRMWGKWHASAEAKRLGETAVAVEAMLLRDGWTIAEALPALRRRWPDVTEEMIESFLSRLPKRAARPRAVAVEMADEVAGETGADRVTFEKDRAEVARRLAAVVREALESHGEEDRLLFRLRFEVGLSIAEISRMLKTEQKPLYRRLQRLLRDLRERVETEGFDATDVEEILGSRSIDLDFGFGMGSPRFRPSKETESSSAGEGEAS